MLLHLCNLQKTAARKKIFRSRSFCGCGTTARISDAASLFYSAMFRKKWLGFAGGKEMKLLGATFYCRLGPLGFGVTAKLLL
jgi:hypothetical protein